MGKTSVSSTIKWQVIGMFKCNKSQREIASALNVSKTCVSQTIAKYRESGNVHDRPRSGRPKVTSPRDDRVLGRLAKQSRNASVPVLRTRLQEISGKNVSAMTVSRRLREQGLHSYMAIRKPLQTAVSRKNRRIWCRQKKNWGMERWGKVLFSDECRFELYSRRRIRVRRTPTEKFLPECLSSAVQQGGGSIMVWGCISMKGTGFIRFTDGSIDSKEYIETMKDTMLPSARKLHGGYYVFQQDNAPCHRSRLSMQWFEENDVPLLPWPARSPDLNPIENVWSYMGAKLAQSRPKTIHELRTMTSLIWSDISIEHCQNLIRSMPTRVKQCLKAAGGVIDY